MCIRDRAYGVEAVAEAADIPRCACGGIIKPDVVLYEEGLDQQTVEDVYKRQPLMRAGVSSILRWPTIC